MPAPTPEIVDESGAVTDKPNLRLLEGGGGGHWGYVEEMKLELGLAASAEPLLAAALLPLMESAERGDLTWSKSVVKYPMGLAADVGELIINIERRQYRLYFAEPVEEDRLLLALKFGYKHGAGWKRMQNDDIREAARRLKTWQKSRVM